MNTKLNRSDFILLAIFWLFAAILNIIQYAIKEYSLIEFFVDIPVSILSALVVIFIFMNLLIPNFLIQGKKYFIFISTGIFTLCFFGVIDELFGYWSSGKVWGDFPKWYTVILEGFYTSVNNTGFIFGILLAKKFYESQTRMANLQKKQKENELKLLRSQINPHFLFNNLNTLDALIDTQPNTAKEYITKLSSIYRYLIKTKDAEVMSLTEEMNFAKDYIFLIQTRFGDDYKFTIERLNNDDEKFLPTGSVQILLENVTKHNVKTTSARNIDVSITVKNDYLKVSNTKSVTESDSLGTGLRNLKSRYKLLTDRKVRISDNDVKFEISLPVIELVNNN